MKEFLRYFLTLSFIGIFFLVILPAFIKLLWSSLLRYYKGNQYADVNTLIKAEVARELGGVVQKVISNISESIEPKIKSDVKSEVARELENNFQNLIDRVYESLEPKIKDTAKKQFEQY